MTRYPDIEYEGNVSGILYEPRAIWSVQRVDTNTNGTGRAVFPRNDLMNAGKYPIVLTKLLLAPANYAYRSANIAAPPTNTANYHIGGASLLQSSSILINAPQRQNYSRRKIPLASFPAIPAWHPTMLNTILGAGVEDTYPSSIWGVTRWDFEHPMIMSRLGTVEIGLSGFDCFLNPADPANIRQVNMAIAVSEGPPHADPSENPIEVLRAERSAGNIGVFPGNVRHHPYSALRYNQGFASIRTSGQGGLGVAGSTQQQQVFLLAYPPSNFGGGTTFETTQQWPPDSQLSAREYAQQNPNAEGSSPITGFATLIEQIDYDDVTIDTFGPATQGAPISPLSFKVAARARTRNGGTGEYWWRQGAPLALVQPTMTPAFVYRLPQPITLAPGDTLDVELQVEPPVTIGVNNIAQIYNVGLSLTGFAAIEG